LRRPIAITGARRLLRGALLAAALLPRAVLAADTPDPAGPAASSPGPATPDAWDYSLSGNGYLFPGDGDFLLGIATADRGPLHLEARYNYEDRDTASFWGGWNWSTGETVEFALTPMLGVAVGDTDAILPGLKLSLAWKQIDSSLASEIAFNLHDHDEDFVYGWSEIGWTPVDWLRVGFVGQRTRVYDTGLDIQRGLLAQGIVGRFVFGLDWFNPASDDEFVVALLGVEF